LSLRLHELGNLTVPFECSDYYGESGLTFSSVKAPDEAIQRAIAEAFWGLLLSAPTDLSDYEDRLYHSGAGVWLLFGVESGEPFMREK
jgi:hypothetical protein